MTRIIFVHWGAMVMRKPAGGVIQIAFGMPSRMATDEPPRRDEDSLDREEGHDDDGQEFDSIDALYSALRDGDEHAVHVATNLARCLQEMAHASSRNDDAGLDKWWKRARQVMDTQPQDKDDNNG
jgi:hypothetical protein